MERLKSTIKGFARFYLSVGTIYFIWTLIVLQFKECGIFGAACQWKIDLSGEIVLGIITSIVPQVVLYSVSVALVRAVLWLPELVADLIVGSFSDWLLSQHVLNMRDFYFLLAQLLP
jgi:hypothetical protein